MESPKKSVKSKNLAPAKTVPPKIEQHKNFTRRNFFKIMGFGIAAIATGSTAYLILEDNTGRQAPKEELIPTEIALGNIRFFLENPSQLSTKERKELFETMKKAHEKLTDYFGEEVTTMYKPMDFPVIIQPMQKDSFEQGRGSFMVNLKLTSDGTPDVLGQPIKGSLILRKKSEDIIAHEFVHLFLQAPGFWSQAFFEGTAYAIQNSLYPESKGSVYQLASIPEVRKLFKDGLDYNIYDREALKGGIQNSALDRLVQAAWGFEFTEILARHPDFLKIFYRKIAEQKNQGKISFSKKDLLNISQSVAPDFDAFYKSSSIKEIGENGKKEIIAAIKIAGENTLIFANFRVIPRKLGQTEMTPPFLEPVLSGEIKVTFYNPQTNESIETAITVSDPAFAVVDFPDEPGKIQVKQVKIGGKEVPVFFGRK